MGKINTDIAFGSDKEKGFRLYLDTWLHNGYNAPSGEHIEMKDFLAVPNSQVWMPKVITEIMREPVEPTLILPSLLDRISHQPGSRITFPAMGALFASDIAEGEGIPEQTLNVAPGTMISTTGKSGVGFKVSEEAIRSSQYDVVSMHLREARRALDRHKEKKGFDMISAMGTHVFNNASPTSSVYGTCTGRAEDGSANGSCRMEDLLKAYSFVLMQGFIPDTILIHPLTWTIWMADPMLQAIMRNTGSGSWFQQPRPPRWNRPWDNASMGGLGKSGGKQWTPGGNAASATATTIEELPQNISGGPSIPSYFPFPLKVLVSSFAPFDPESQVADILVFDSMNLGALIVEQEPTPDSWEDKSVGLEKFKIIERYSFGIYHDGLACAVLKNVPTVPNMIASPITPTISSAGSLDVLNPLTSITGL